jgi:hypothetical protein
MSEKQEAGSRKYRSCLWAERRRDGEQVRGEGAVAYKQ